VERLVGYISLVETLRCCHRGRYTRLLSASRPSRPRPRSTRCPPSRTSERRRLSPQRCDLGIEHRGVGLKLAAVASLVPAYSGSRAPGVPGVVATRNVLVSSRRRLALTGPGKSSLDGIMGHLLNWRLMALAGRTFAIWAAHIHDSLGSACECRYLSSRAATDHRES
jgi:hypothetical protein